MQREVREHAVQVCKPCDELAPQAPRAARPEPCRGDRQAVVEAIGEGKAQTRCSEVVHRRPPLDAVDVKEVADPLPALSNGDAALQARHHVMNSRRRFGAGGRVAGEQDPGRHLIHGDQVDPRVRIRDDRAQVAQSRQHHEPGEAGGAVDPPRERMVPACRDDTRAHDRERYGAVPGHQQVLRQGLRQGVRVGVAGLGEKLALDGAAVEDRTVDFLRGPGQGCKGRLDGRASAGVGCHVRRGDTHELLQPRTGARQLEQVEARRNVRTSRVGERKVEIHRGRGMQHVGDLPCDLVARGRVEAEAGLLQRALDDLHPLGPVHRKVTETIRRRHLMTKALFGGARRLRADQNVHTLDPELLAPAQQLLEQNLP